MQFLTVHTLQALLCRHKLLLFSSFPLREEKASVTPNIPALGLNSYTEKPHADTAERIKLAELLKALDTVIIFAVFRTQTIMGLLSPVTDAV